MLDPSFLQDVNVNVLPRSDATYNLGSSTLRWRSLFLASGVGYNLSVGSISAGVHSSTYPDFYITLHGVASDRGMVIAHPNPSWQTIMYLRRTDVRAISLNPLSDNAYDLGGPTLRWRNLHLSGNVWSPRWQVVGGLWGWLGLAPFIMGNALGFRAPYRAELSTDGGATWSDVTGSYPWAYLTDGRATDVYITVTANVENRVRLYYDIGSWSFASALVLVVWWIDRLTYVKVEASSYSDFSADVVTLYEATPNIVHWDVVSVHLFTSHPGGRRYVRITLGFMRTTDGQCRFRELLLLTYTDINRMWEGYLPITWDHNRNIYTRHLQPEADNTYDLGGSTRRWRDIWASRNAYVAGNLGVGTTAPAERLHVAGNIRSYSVLPDSDNAYDLGSPSLRWRDVYAVTVKGALISLD